MPTAFAIACDVKVQEIFDFLGHDGSQILWPTLDEPYRRKSFHIEEMFDFCLSIRRSVTPVTMHPITRPHDAKNNHYPYLASYERYMKYLNDYDGVLISGNHAVAWLNNRIYDPNGEVYGFQNQYRTFFIIKSF